MSERLFVTPVQGLDSDERYTPRWIFDGLGLMFDLDPASPVEGGDCVPARRKYTRLDDGLAQPWEGLVWLNPPFSESTAWAARFRDHRNGVFLGPVANGRWWSDLARHANVIWHCRDFAFTHPLHAGRRSSMPLAMMAIDEPATSAVRRLAHSGVQDGVLVVPERAAC
jgi:DNA N-6-adenine-methyltransferase (Dam)